MWNLDGRIALVTGANDGIGRATALGLARMGARVVMACRDERKGRDALDSIAADSGNRALELLVADLSSQSDIRRLASEYQRRHDRLHVLVNNAGLAAPRRTLTADGVELTFAVNYVAPFLLTTLLRPQLEAGAPARVVNVGSAMEEVGRLDFDDLAPTRRFSPMRAYGRSKLALLLFTYEMARRLDPSRVTVNCVHPGLVATKILGTAGWRGALLARLARPFSLTPEQGADTVLYLAASPEVEGVTGRYFEKRHEKRSSERSHDADAARRLWTVSEQLTSAAPRPGRPA